MSSTKAPRITYYIVLLPQHGDTMPSLHPLSRLLQIEEDKLKALLELETYDVVSRFAKKANAQGLQSQLTALGVSSILISDQDIRGHMILSAASANVGAGGLAFRDFEDKPLFCPFDDIVGIVMMVVGCNDGTETTLVDIHRRSTNITLRLDRNLFDFSRMLNREGAGLEDFLDHLVEKTGAGLDAIFEIHRDQLVAKSRDFATRPIDLAPPLNKIEAPYKKEHQVAANLYTLVRSIAARA
ncbi:MAG: hypothetical protein JJU11_05830 [Candidatus Sumerlaeia bacterium]|nr:hypothetical protein [Candidatus Sumerlaeia bacterium]